MEFIRALVLFLCLSFALSQDDIQKCQTASDCPITNDECRVCDDGYEPSCPQATCIDGVCSVIEPCSECSPETSTTTSSTTLNDDRCTEYDLSRCQFDRICAMCLPGLSPGCSQAKCLNGHCQVIPPCSIGSPIESTTVGPSTISDSEGCKDARACPYPEYCATECKEGLGPLCASAKCVGGKCVVIRPCSEPLQCQGDDASPCLVNRICAKCAPGYSPGCTEATCENGQCRITSACSIFNPNDASTTTISPGDQCKSDGECAYVKRCVSECKEGSGPLCATSRCIDGQCVVTEPCSQEIQCTDNDISRCVVPMVCAECLEGYSPPCAQATCDNGQCRTVSPCSIYSSTIAPEPMCRKDPDCIVKGYCVDQCPKGFGPQCTVAKCIDGQCIITQPCSQKLQCTDDDVSQCVIEPLICARCLPGFSPGCSEAVCDNGQCKIISPCSIQNPTTTPLSTTIPKPGCYKDFECIVKGYCVDQCPEGFGPQCTTGRCIDGQCVIIQPCSQKNECSKDDLSKCPIPKICQDCKPGYSPRCAEARCNQGRCDVIMPCSIYSETTVGPTLPRTLFTRTIRTTISTIPPRCTRHSQCSMPPICVRSCPNGMTPLCSFGKCVGGKCVEIRACSQRTCTVAATCPFNKNNCMKCAKGFGPGCEEPLCKCGICSIIKPCSKKIAVESISLPIQDV